MMLSLASVASLAFLFTQCALAQNASTANSGRQLGPRPGQIKTLVTFGDSYTDTVNTGDGGVAWPDYAAEYGGFRLFPFARAGATCSNELTPRPWPSVFESQIPAFTQQRQNGSLRVSQQETIYTLWIGTNDVGANALLTGSQRQGVSVVDTTACAINWVRTLYGLGARNFLFQNMIPLEDTPIYSAKSHPNRYWTAPRNTTAWTVSMADLTSAGNALSRLMLQDLAPQLRGAHVGLFDSYQLFNDIMDSPAAFLNGTVQPNISGSIHSCVFEENADTSGQGVCTTVSGAAADSYLWYDELHPSEQANRVVARHVTNAITRQSNRYTTWFS